MCVPDEDIPASPLGLATTEACIPGLDLLGQPGSTNAVSGSHFESFTIVAENTSCEPGPECVNDLPVIAAKPGNSPASSTLKHGLCSLNTEYATSRSRSPILEKMVQLLDDPGQPPEPTRGSESGHQENSVGDRAAPNIPPAVVLNSMQDKNIKSISIRNVPSPPLDKIYDLTNDKAAEPETQSLGSYKQIDNENMIHKPRPLISQEEPCTGSFILANSPKSLFSKIKYLENDPKPFVDESLRKNLPSLAGQAEVKSMKITINDEEEFNVIVVDDSDESNELSENQQPCADLKRFLANAPWKHPVIEDEHEVKRSDPSFDFENDQCSLEQDDGLGGEKGQKSGKIPSPESLQKAGLLCDITTPATPTGCKTDFSHHPIHSDKLNACPDDTKNQKYLSGISPSEHKPSLSPTLKQGDEYKDAAISAFTPDQSSSCSKGEFPSKQTPISINIRPKQSKTIFSSCSIDVSLCARQAKEIYQFYGSKHLQSKAPVSRKASLAEKILSPCKYNNRNVTSVSYRTVDDDSASGPPTRRQSKVRKFSKDLEKEKVASGEEVLQENSTYLTGKKSKLDVVGHASSHRKHDREDKRKRTDSDGIGQPHQSRSKRKKKDKSPSLNESHRDRSSETASRRSHTKIKHRSHSPMKSKHHTKSHSHSLSNADKTSSRKEKKSSDHKKTRDENDETVDENHSSNSAGKKTMTPKMNAVVAAALACVHKAAATKPSKQSSGSILTTNELIKNKASDQDKGKQKNSITKPVVSENSKRRPLFPPAFINAVSGNKLLGKTGNYTIPKINSKQAKSSSSSPIYKALSDELSCHNQEISIPANSASSHGDNSPSETVPAVTPVRHDGTCGTSIMQPVSSVTPSEDHSKDSDILPLPSCSVHDKDSILGTLGKLPVSVTISKTTQSVSTAARIPTILSSKSVLPSQESQPCPQSEVSCPIDLRHDVHGPSLKKVT